MYDIVIIGAGVTGSLIARNLSRYTLNVLVIDKCSDVGNVTSSANSAIVHAGYDPKPGSLKAILNVKGAKMYENLCKELDVTYDKCGTLLIINDESGRDTYNDLINRAKLNDVPLIELSKEETLKMEPNINDNCIGSLYAPMGGIVNPFELVVNAMENAVDNGVKLSLNEEVVSIYRENDNFKVKTNENVYDTKVVINASGTNADKIASMVENISWNINPRKGEYVILDNNAKGLVSRPIFPLPTIKGKGILVGITTHGEIYLGPTSEDTNDPNDFSTDQETLSYIKQEASRLVKNIPINNVLRVFSGIRATPSTHDFIIEPSKKYKEFINVAGIESPGLASSPAIAEYVIDKYISKLFTLQNKKKYNPKVKKHIKMYLLDDEEKNKIIKQNKDYGKIICQCEQITLGEIKDALSRSVPPTSIKAIKRRTRAGFGKCQGGYCMSRIINLLINEYHINPTDILYDNEGSNIIKEVK